MCVHSSSPWQIDLSWVLIGDLPHVMACAMRKHSFIISAVKSDMLKLDVSVAGELTP